MHAFILRRTIEDHGRFGRQRGGSGQRFGRGERQPRRSRQCLACRQKSRPRRWLRTALRGRSEPPQRRTPVQPPSYRRLSASITRTSTLGRVMEGARLLRQVRAARSGSEEARSPLKGRPQRAGPSVNPDQRSDGAKRPCVGVRGVPVEDGAHIAKTSIPLSDPPATTPPPQALGRPEKPFDVFHGTLTTTTSPTSSPYVPPPVTISPAGQVASTNPE